MRSIRFGDAHQDAMSSTSHEVPVADLRDLLIEAFFAGDLDRVMKVGRARMLPR
jgi:hypothetical protein